ncbi:DUF861 domain-containing protein [Sinorhizobium meliloti]|nr:DUF861 domain-containing protein [Sinorhizobium meliloti]MQV76832.1 DUF861 domain-containing protein [Sinorhizobium meliloti]
MNMDIFRSNFAVDASWQELPEVPWPSMTVLAGNPIVRHLPLNRNAQDTVERGLWEIDPGVVEDTEVDELHVVLSGVATVEFLDLDLPPLELRPGVVGFFSAGTRTRWTITERLRKVYQIPAN